MPLVRVRPAITAWVRRPRTIAPPSSESVAPLAPTSTHVDSGGAAPCELGQETPPVGDLPEVVAEPIWCGAGTGYRYTARLGVGPIVRWAHDPEHQGARALLERSHLGRFVTVHATTGLSRMILGTKKAARLTVVETVRDELQVRLRKAVPCPPVEPPARFPGSAVGRILDDCRDVKAAAPANVQADATAP